MSRVRTEIDRWSAEIAAANKRINDVNQGRTSPVIDKLLAQRAERERKIKDKLRKPYAK